MSEPLRIDELDIPLKGKMYDPTSIFRIAAFWRGAIEVRLADIRDQQNIGRLHRLLSAAERKEPIIGSEDFRHWLAQ